jgi:uncharacterized protein
MLARGPAFRLLPRLDDDNTFFWTSGSDGQLRFLRCQDCHTFVHPPSPVCPGCLSRDLTPEVVSGRANTCNVQQWIPGSDPYLIGLVAIAEQESVRLTTNLVDLEEDQAHDGMELEVVFEQADEVYLPLFRPVEGGAGS